ncbi:MAG: chorismate synthase, partial [Anaerolineae bacterium]
AAAMRRAIQEAVRRKDTLGGVFEVVALGVPPGLGSHVHGDRRLTARLLGAAGTIPAVKGAEVGPAFANAARPGTEVHDTFHVAAGRVTRTTNRAGGLEGGISTGEAVVLRCAMKPLSSTLTPLASVDLASGEETPASYERSDFCAVPRAAVVGEAVVGLVLADALLEKLGGDSLAEMGPRFEALTRSEVASFNMANRPWRLDPRREASGAEAGDG